MRVELLVLAWFAAGALVFAVRYWHTLVAVVTEPVLRVPVVIFESDDWGPGPVSDAEALRELILLLESFAGGDGRHPVLTMGVILSCANTQKIVESDFREFRARDLDDPAYAEILATLRDGESRGVFALQLHGETHYWPAALLAAGRTDPAVREWFSGIDGARTENLPSHLQSRWTNAAVLPSEPHPVAQVNEAAGREVGLYYRIFGRLPQVVVPPTFVWTDDVEAAWVKAGVKVLITPGSRFDSRDASGRPICSRPQQRPIYNGLKSPAGLRYLVRDLYFEPELKHRAAERFGGAREKFFQERRPALIEMHRFNFTNPATRQANIGELRGFYELILQDFPECRFMSSEELASAYIDGTGSLFESRPLVCFAAWVARLRRVPGLTKAAWVSGIALPVAVFALIARALVQSSSPVSWSPHHAQ